MEMPENSGGFEIAITDNFKLNETKRSGFFLHDNLSDETNLKIKRLVDIVNGAEEFGNAHSSYENTIIAILNQLKDSADPEKLERTSVHKYLIDDCTKILQKYASQRATLAFSAIKTYDRTLIYCQINYPEESDSFHMFIELNEDGDFKWVDLFLKTHDPAAKTNKLIEEWIYRDDRFIEEQKKENNKLKAAELRETNHKKRAENSNSLLVQDNDEHDQDEIAGNSSTDDEVFDRQNDEKNRIDSLYIDDEFPIISDDDEVHDDKTSSDSVKYWLSLQYEENELVHQYWQSWAQWIYMYRHEDSIEDERIKFFMKTFMTLVAKELFGIEGDVENVKLHETKHETGDPGLTVSRIIADHVNEGNRKGKIFIVYKKVPLVRSMEGYSRIINNTEKDVEIVYCGNKANEDYCSPGHSIQFDSGTVESESDEGNEYVSGQDQFLPRDQSDELSEQEISEDKDLDSGYADQRGKNVTQMLEKRVNFENLTDERINASALKIQALVRECLSKKKTKKLAGEEQLRAEGENLKKIENDLDAENRQILREYEKIAEMNVTSTLKDVLKATYKNLQEDNNMQIEKCSVLQAYIRMSNAIKHLPKREQRVLQEKKEKALQEELHRINKDITVKNEETEVLQEEEHKELQEELDQLEKDITGKRKETVDLED